MCTIINVQNVQNHFKKTLTNNGDDVDVKMQQPKKKW